MVLVAVIVPVPVIVLRGFAYGPVVAITLAITEIDGQYMALLDSFTATRPTRDASSMLITGKVSLVIQK